MSHENIDQDCLKIYFWLYDTDKHFPFQLATGDTALTIHSLRNSLIIEKNRKEIERKLIAKKTEPKQSFDLWIPNLSLKSLNKTKVNFKRMIDTFIPSFH